MFARSLRVHKSIVQSLLLLAFPLLTVMLVYSRYELAVVRIESRMSIDSARRAHRTKLLSLFEAVADVDQTEGWTSLRRLKQMLRTELNLDVESSMCGVGLRKFVCDEKRLVVEGDVFQHWVGHNFVSDMDKCPKERKDIVDLVTLVLVVSKSDHHVNISAEHLASLGFPIVIISGDDGLIDHSTLSNNERIQVLAMRSRPTNLMDVISTPFLMYIGSDTTVLESEDMELSLERALRLLQQDEVAVVSGAARVIDDGHWHLQCFQMDIKNYRLTIRPGYEHSSCDCMQCDLLLPPSTTSTWSSSPLIMPTHLLTNNPLPVNMSSVSEWMTWMMRVRLVNNFLVYSCPDLTFDVQRAPLQLTQIDDWTPLGVQMQVMSVILLENNVQPHVVFTCEQIDLSCDPYDSQSAKVLLPYCCLRAFKHMMRSFDALADELDFHYELDSGSLLGAVKVGHMLSWDIDGDLYMQTEAIHLFDEGQVGQLRLKESGVQVIEHSKDNYWDKGAGYFRMAYDNVEVEVGGRRGNLSVHVNNKWSKATRVRVGGDLWLRVHAHPGQYLRSRYGPGYLKHAQSWRFQSDMTNAFDVYRVGQWDNCHKYGLHVCLDKHPADGNIHFHQDLFKDIYN